MEAVGPKLNRSNIVHNDYVSEFFQSQQKRDFSLIKAANFQKFEGGFVGAEMERGGVSEPPSNPEKFMHPPWGFGRSPKF
jgi:hypothetical protein